jgi:hypothetical protein
VDVFLETLIEKSSLEQSTEHQESPPAIPFTVNPPRGWSAPGSRHVT